MVADGAGKAEAEKKMGKASFSHFSEPVLVLIVSFYSLDSTVAGRTRGARLFLFYALLLFLVIVIVFS